jgi:hypothetical protein
MTYELVWTKTTASVLAASHFGRAAVCRQQTLARAHLQSTKRPRWHRGDKDVTASIAHKGDLTTVLEKKRRKWRGHACTCRLPSFFFIILTMQKVKQTCISSWLYLEYGTSNKQPLLPKLYYFLMQTINRTKHIFIAISILINYFHENTFLHLMCLCSGINYSIIFLLYFLN